jgi:hypothetical protein
VQLRNEPVWVALHSILVVLGSWWVASNGAPRPRAEAVADLKDARNFMVTGLPEEARELIVPKLDEMADQADR